MTIARKHPQALCEECPLYGRPTAFTQGPTNASVALVSRSPGFYEAQAGKPFSGPSGKVLDYLLEENGVKRDQILVTNTVLCAPKEGKVPPQAIKCCEPRLRSELRTANTVIAAGSEAVGVILGRTGIDSLRGYDHRIDGKRVVVTNNPAIVLRDDQTFPNLVKDFKLAFNPRPKPTLPTVEVIDDPEEAIVFLRRIGTEARGTQVAADIETRGGLSHRAKLLSFNISTDGSKATVIGETACNAREVIDELKTLLEDRRIEFIWHNGKFDIKVLRTQHGINAKVDEDTLLLGYACDERPGVHSLEYMLMDEFAWPNYSSDEIESFKKTGQGPIPAGFYDYAGLDAAGTYQLYKKVRKRSIEDEVFDSPYQRLLIRGCEALTRLELAGIRYNYGKAAEIYEDEVEPALDEQKQELREQIDNPLFNPRSWQQLAALYYDDWKVQHPAQRRPDKELSVDKGARETILEGNFTTPFDRRRVGREPQEVIDAHRKEIANFTRTLDDFKSLDKQASTYLLALIEKAEKDPDGKVYTEFNLAGTESGRLSSKGPNLQNITRPKEGLPNIRRLFEASPGRNIVQADYSQAELRTIAYLSGDPELRAIYYDTSRSLHKEMAESFYGAGYSYEEYVKAKNIDFGIFYLQGAFSFSTMYHMDQLEAQDFINNMWNRFPVVRNWTEQTKNEVKSVGTLVNPFGRKRRFYLLTDENRDHSFKEAINFKAQSTASDITLSALILLVDLVDWTRCSICLTVHDSIVADVDKSYIEEYCAITKEVMESRPQEELGWDIPFVADFSVGPNWGELTDKEIGEKIAA